MFCGSSDVICVIYSLVEGGKQLKVRKGLFFSSQNGKHDEGWMILKQVHDTNMRAKGYPERVFSVSICVKISLYQNCKQVTWNTHKHTHRLLFMPLNILSVLPQVTTIKTVKQIDELVDIGTDTPIWQRYRLKIMSLSQQVREAERLSSPLALVLVRSLLMFSVAPNLKGRGPNVIYSPSEVVTSLIMQMY